MHASSKGFRVHWEKAGAEPQVIKGPFPAKELICGFWVIKTETTEEALEWVKKCPVVNAPNGATIELRPFVELEDMAEAFTPETLAAQQKLRVGEDERLANKC